MINQAPIVRYTASVCEKFLSDFRKKTISAESVIDLFSSDKQLLHQLVHSAYSFPVLHFLISASMIRCLRALTRGLGARSRFNVQSSTCRPSPEKALLANARRQTLCSRQFGERPMGSLSKERRSSPAQAKRLRSVD